MLQLFELFHIQKDIEDLRDTFITVELEINEYEADKELATELLKRKQKELKIKLKDLETIEQDFNTMEKSFKEKEADFVELKEKVLYWQQKLNSANLLLVEAHASNRAHTKTVEELQDTIKQVEELLKQVEENMQTQLLTQNKNIESNDAQVQLCFYYTISSYFCLKFNKIYFYFTF